MTYFKKTWVCEYCLRASAIIYDSQKEATKRWRKSAQGREAVQRYEQGKGKEARERYLKSEKYKQRRKEYNQRMKESLNIRRDTIKLEAARADPEHTTQKLTAVVRDLKDGWLSWGKRPDESDVIKLCEGYGIEGVTPEQAQELLNRAKELYHG